MKVNDKNKIYKIVYLIDKHIIDLLNEKEVNEDKVETLTSIRVEYIKELNSIIRVQNTREMFKRKK